MGGNCEFMNLFPLWQEQYYKKLSCTLPCLLQIVASILTMLLVFIALNAILHHCCQHSGSPTATGLYLPLSHLLRQFYFLRRLVSGCSKAVSDSPITQITSSIKAYRFRYSTYRLLMERKLSVWWARNGEAALQKKKTPQKKQMC